MKLKQRLARWWRELAHPDRALRWRVRRALRKMPRDRVAYGECLSADERVDLLVALLKEARPEHRAALLTHAGESHGQLFQDLFVLSELGPRARAGFFVEFGAADGVALSNTWLLEKRLGWKGVLAEPGRCWHEALSRQRACVVETDCVWARTGETLEFGEAPTPELSGLRDCAPADGHEAVRAAGRTYRVSTVSLADLLLRHGAPAEPDYLSIDTEGSELEILKAFDFDRFRFKVITCEHNHTPAREDLHRLLTARGYRRKHEAFSRFDDWYVRADLP